MTAAVPLFPCAVAVMLAEPSVSPVSTPAVDKEATAGALVAQEGLSEREAFERLRHQARSQRRRVVEVAAEIMAAIRHT